MLNDRPEDSPIQSPKFFLWGWKILLQLPNNPLRLPYNPQNSAFKNKKDLKNKFCIMHNS